MTFTVVGLLQAFVLVADLDSRELTINASRGDVPGATAQYELP